MADSSHPIVTLRPHPQAHLSTSRPPTVLSPAFLRSPQDAGDGANGWGSGGAAVSSNSAGRVIRIVSDVLGYSDQSGGMSIESLKFARFVLFLVLSSSQIISIIIVLAFASVRASPAPRPWHPEDTELQTCGRIGAFLVMWLVRLIFKCYSEVQLFRRNRGSHQPAFYDEYICPLNLTTFPLLIHQLDHIVLPLFTLLGIALAAADGRACHTAARSVWVTSLTILMLSVVYYHPVFILKLAREREARGRPSIKGITQDDVDRIPLVLYIPPAPISTAASPIDPLPVSISNSSSPLATTSPSHAKRRRFIFLRPSPSRPASGLDGIAIARNGSGWNYPDRSTPYPLIRLPANLATCSICLADFEAPRWAVSVPNEEQKDEAVGHEMTTIRRVTEGGEEGDVAEVRVEPPQPADTRTVQLVRSGSVDAPEPLRLLGCGHVFHRSCVDKWLTKESGRCPLCQAQVLVPLLSRKKGGGGWLWWSS